MDDNALQVTPQSVTLTLAAGSGAVSVEELHQSLVKHHISHGIKREALQTAVELSAAGQAVLNLLLAEATPAGPGEPGRVDVRLPMGKLAAPGDLLAEWIPPAGGTPGMSVTGEQISFPAAASPLKAGENTELVGDQLKALRYGSVKNKGGATCIEPLLTISPDKLEATLDIHPSSDAGTTITAELILAELKAASIIHGIQSEGITAALETGRVQNRVVVAQGLAAQAAYPADFLFHFTIEGKNPHDLAAAESPATLLPLLADGTHLATESPATPASAGKNILGEEIKPPPPKKSSSKIKMGKGVRKEDRSGDYFAEVLHCGYVSLSAGQLNMIPPVRISDDLMQVFLTVYPAMPGHLALDLAEIEHLLKAMNVSYGIDNNVFQQALAQVAATGEPMVDVVIARGRDAVNGKDERLEYLLDNSTKAGAATEDGRVNFRERGTILSLEPGNAIAKIVPPTAGQAQIDVHGQSTPAKAGKDIHFAAGDRVELREGIFYATDHGALMVRGNLVTITEIYEWDGDVGLETGNLRHDRGTIQIKGNIQSGFEVNARDHVMITANVDNATVIAGGDVNVGNGVIQREESDAKVMAAGNVTVKFAQNAKIYAYKNIYVNGAAMNCTLHAKGSIEITKGKGSLIGGQARASKKITVKQMGSDAGVITLAIIEVDPKRLKAIDKEIDEQQKLLEAVSQSNVEAAIKIQSEIDALQVKKRKIIDQVRNQGCVIIEGIAHVGSIVKILDHTYTFKEERKRCKVSLQGGRKFEISPIT